MRDTIGLPGGEHRTVRELGPTDALHFFFEDVATLPVIDGKYGYLPLTRRIRRLETLTQLHKTTPAARTAEATLTALRGALRPFLSDVRRGGGHWSAVELARLDGEIEPFLDAPEQAGPPALDAIAHQVDKDREVADRLWQEFYLLTLVPPGSRAAIESVTVEDAAAHFARVREEGRAARTQLLEGTLRYVVNIAEDYANRGLPYLDLVQEGFFGLARATSGFDERKGHFQQYAATWIRQRMDRAIIEKASLIRIPVHVREQLAQADKAGESGTWVGEPETNDGDGRAGEVLLAGAVDAVQTTSSSVQTTKRPSSQPKKVLAATKSSSGSYARSHQIAASFDPQQAAVVPTLPPADQLLEKSQKIGRKEGVASGGETENRRDQQVERQRRLAVATAAHYSLERAVLPLVGEDDQPLTFADALPAADDVEGEVEAADFGYFLHRYLESEQSALTEKEARILALRFGFDGKERTLEEIGRADGLTRERIRQIEAKAKRKLENRLLHGQMERHVLPPRRKAFTPPLFVAVLAGLRDADRIALPADDRARIHELIRVYVRRGRKVRWTSGHIGKRELLCEVLRDLGRPTHYNVIHERAMALAPEGKQFSKRVTYSRLFYDTHLFRYHGNAVFGLVAWGDERPTEDGETIFRHCPAPLMPSGAPPAALFDSLELGRQLLGRGPQTAAGFWQAMCAWAGVANVRPQEAFNAWYAAGLLGLVRYETESDHRLTLTAPADAPLTELRTYALATAARRVERLPELLLALESLGQPTVEALTELLYGDIAEGFEVAARLRLLAGLGGVRAVGDEWQLTAAGRAALAALPAPELPDEPPPPDELDADWVDLDVYTLELNL